MNIDVKMILIVALVALVIYLTFRTADNTNVDARTINQNQNTQKITNVSLIGGDAGKNIANGVKKGVDAIKDLF